MLASPSEKREAAERRSEAAAEAVETVGRVSFDSLMDLRI